MKNSFYIDLQRFMLIPTKFPLTRFISVDASNGLSLLAGLVDR